MIADANFPAEACAKRLIRLPGFDGMRAVSAIMSVFPLDTYTDDPAVVIVYGFDNVLHTPVAGRIFWIYGPGKGDITIIGLEPHPNDKKGNAYKKITLSQMGQEIE